MNIKEYEFECGECPSTKTEKPVKLILGDEYAIGIHMTEAHQYSEADVKKLIQCYHNDVPQTEDGDVLFQCSSHGDYVDMCYGCEAIDSAIDSWKESRHA